MTTIDNNIDNNIEVLVISPCVLLSEEGKGIQDQIRESIIHFHNLPSILHSFIFTIVCPTDVIFPPPEEELPQIYKMDRVQFIRVPPQPLIHYRSSNDYMLKLLEPVQMVGAVMNFYRRHNRMPDIIHSYDWSTAYAAKCISLHFNKPWLFTCSLSNKRSAENIRQLNPSLQLDGIVDFASELEEYAIYNANHVIHVSNAQAQYFDKLYLHKTNVIHNGIKIPESLMHGKLDKSAFPNLPGHPEHKKILFLGRLTLQKNLVELLKCTLPPKTDLIIAGPVDGMDQTVRSALETRLLKQSQGDDEKKDTQFGEGQVYFLGAIHGARKWHLLSVCDFVILPSLHEPFGLVALEAMAARTVVISSFVEGMAEFLNSSFAIPCGTTQSNIEEALLYASLMKDEEYQKRIESGWQVAQCFTWTRVSRTLAAIYEYLHCL